MALLKHNTNLTQLLLKFMNTRDPMNEMLQWFCNAMMEAELEAKLNAGKSERTDTRKGYRSGYRVRRFDTRMGTVYLMVPKVRKGGYVPFFVTARKRSEAALMSVIQEAYVTGVSTRKIERLGKEMGIESLSSGQVSIMTKEPGEKVQNFRNRRLTKEYRVLWVDALYEKVRENGFVKNIAVLVVTGLDDEGHREIIAVEPMREESRNTYGNLFESLKRRGLNNPWLVVSDAHQGLVKAVSEHFAGCSWQRCKVHFMRNILAHVSPRDKAGFAEKLKQIWLQPDGESARAYAEWFMEAIARNGRMLLIVLQTGWTIHYSFFNFQ